MKFKSTALCIALVPALATLAACNKDNDSDDMAPATTAPADTMPADSNNGMADETTPADNVSPGGMENDGMPVDSVPTDAMASGDGMSFADMDKNGDGGISKDELASGQMLYDHFSVADADGNGMLSEAEVTKHRADMTAAPTQ